MVEGSICDANQILLTEKKTNIKTVTVELDSQCFTDFKMSLLSKTSTQHLNQSFNILNGIILERVPPCMSKYNGLLTG